MDNPENLPATLANQNLSVSKDNRRNLMARGMAAVLLNQQQLQTKSNDALYRQARDVYNKLTDYGFEVWSGCEERRQPLAEVFNTFKQLAEQGYGKAYFPLSNLFLGEQSIKGDAVQAERLRKLAYDWLSTNKNSIDKEIWHDLGALKSGGDSYYLWRLGEMSSTGFTDRGPLGNGPEVIVEQDDDEAEYWYQRSANLGEASSMWQLSCIYGDKEDWEVSLYWQIKAAIAGHEKAQSGLEVQHEQGNLADRIDEEQVFEWYTWSAEDGYLWAQLYLAEAYAHGDYGLNIDEELASYWYSRAAVKENAEAQCNLGFRYEYGRGIAQSYEQAIYWLTKAADQGHGWAQNNIGLMYENGKGVEKSLNKAVEYYKKAADVEHGGAIARLKELGINWKTT